MQMRKVARKSSMGFVSSLLVQITGQQATAALKQPVTIPVHTHVYVYVFYYNYFCKLESTQK
jgi:hypothetical protein